MQAVNQDNMNDRFGDVAVSRTGAIATVLIDRPDKLNAMRRRFWKDLRDAFALLLTDGQTRVAIITGAGDRAFSVGGDIVEFAALGDVDDARAYQRDAMATFAEVERAPIMVIAAVNGLALGGGCELTLACDMAIASDEARFAMPESALGLVPGYGVVRAAERIGRSMTKFLIASGETITAKRAYEVGLVQALCPPAELMQRAITLAERISTRSTGALAVGKRLIDRDPDGDAIEVSINALTLLQGSADRHEGVAAFLEKRSPVFQPPATPKPQ